MARRIVRTLSQIGAFLVLALLLIFLADSRYRVLPNSIHSVLPSHHPGTVITDVTIAYCSSVNPLSKCRLDPKKWDRIEKDLYLGSGWVQSAYVHVQRKKEEELTHAEMVIVDIKIGKLLPEVDEKNHPGAVWERRQGGLYVLRSSKRHDSDSDKAITAVDILYGADAVDPRPKWELLQVPLLVDGGDRNRAARLSIRRGKPKSTHRDLPVPRVRKDGRFKILQISDAHLATGVGTCRDAIGEGNQPSTKCEADTRTLDFIEKILDDEKPDMVVLSGDQVEGPQAPDTQSAIFKMVAPLVERSIPYAAIFGNHDDEGSQSLRRPAQMSILETLPFSLSEAGPAEADGTGNYYVEVMAHSNQHSALTLYMLDTHSLSPDEKKYHGYDWIKPSQTKWFKTTSQELKRSRAHIKYSHIHMDMAFIHIPLPEYAEKANIRAGGEWKEGVTAPGYNSHFYDALHEEGVVSVGCGHDHVNDYCMLKPNTLTPRVADDQYVHHGDKPARRGPWMCYAGGSGFGGYAGYGGFHRRVRVWEVDTNAGRLETWKRVECCGEETKKRIDELVLVEGGTVVEPS
ncbi:unnamed protein product [Zymoseptoria tritici ST99CH_1A5]|uniref:Calcineurin-like phosphoesterase domain-containing protein n=4 Tax=Zymoseptoria tritici TaxID=1047171 RepID=F9WY42_ZYMTI|nr:uncharacterized protein MYCGRDRAFT_66394 [Zymoseptoria tritici IPO323]EGP92254.1 hypothetical protein MYCGRDRAFT_66394 [Zymoseptoria tritici IPO323]SMQ46082.1 unnamed protein product [Zymoseptoria tritici ST99CH_3D7]SMR42426.1 unnamed protein product [Zymoseptoria tritici ST99CH_1E4]SMY19767.1 unnamed protein product [Zymoseptoria tritici ST99CH_1A5]